MLIINLTQKVKIKWVTRNIKTYTSLGYTYTKVGDEFEILLSELNTDSNYKVDVICDVCGSHVLTPYRNYNKIISNNGIYRCKTCTSKNNNRHRVAERSHEYYERFIAICKEKNYIPVTTEQDINGCKTEVKYICPKHGLMHINLDNLIRGAGCRKCADESISGCRIITKEELISRIGSKNKNTLINPDDYKGIYNKNLVIKCGSCGKIFISSLATIDAGSGACRECGNKKISQALKISSSEIIKELEKYPEREILNIDEYVGVNRRNLQVRCTECGDIFNSSLSSYLHKNLTRCKKCVAKMSYGEYYIYNYLLNENICFVSQKRFKDCKDKKPLPFDFYLPDYNLCIEFDGIQHSRPVRGYKAFEKTNKHDKIKDEYCKTHNIHLLRISSSQFDDINEILRKNLNSIQKI